MTVSGVIFVKLSHVRQLYLRSSHNEFYRNSRKCLISDIRLQTDGRTDIGADVNNLHIMHYILQRKASNNH
jgi:hypothetical protein